MHLDLSCGNSIQMKRAGDRRRQVIEPLLPRLHDFYRLRDRPAPGHAESGNHVDRAGAKIEIRDDPKISVAAAAQCPEQIGIFLFACIANLPRRIDHLHRQDIIACEAKGTPQQPKTSPQRVARDAYRKTASRRNRHVAWPERRVNRSERCTGADRHRLPVGR